MKVSRHRIIYRLKGFEQAASDLAFIGAAHPCDRAAIRDRYDCERAKLLALFDEAQS